MDLNAAIFPPPCQTGGRPGRHEWLHRAAVMLLAEGAA